MRHAIIKNGKIKSVVVGLAPDDGVVIQQNWTQPEEYPSSFYVTETSQPLLSVVDGDVFEDWVFILKPLDVIKADIYAAQKVKRQKMQLGSFDFGGTAITLKDREDSLIISSLPEVDTRYKVAQGAWVTLTGAEVAALKEAHRAHVQAAYDWEESANMAVHVLDSYTALENLYLQRKLLAACYFTGS